MKIVILSGASSIHTIRWANGLSESGHEVHLISQHVPKDSLLSSVKLYLFPFRGEIGYFLMVPEVRRIIKKLKPDIINAHYASGYGTTARLVNIKPLVLSVWGSDVYDFPYKSPIHSWLVRKNLRAANTIASTSYCMADQTRKVLGDTELIIPITPFGVDMSLYKDAEKLEINDSRLVVGTVKTMADKYGIDVLIRAFALLKHKLMHTHPNVAQILQLRLVGGGPKTDELKNLVSTLGISDVTTFVGQVPHELVPEELAKIDIYVALSRLDSESFGVAIIEAGAAYRPVVVSDVGGLPEVVINNQTGMVVPRENPEAAAEALEKLVLNPNLRIEMGVAGKAHVQEAYNWDICVKTMEQVFKQTLDSYNGG